MGEGDAERIDETAAASEDEEGSASYGGRGGRGNGLDRIEVLGETVEDPTSRDDVEVAERSENDAAQAVGEELSRSSERALECR